MIKDLFLGFLHNSSNNPFLQLRKKYLKEGIFLFYKQTLRNKYTLTMIVVTGLVPPFQVKVPVLIKHSFTLTDVNI